MKAHRISPLLEVQVESDLDGIMSLYWAHRGSLPASVWSLLVLLLPRLPSLLWCIVLLCMCRSCAMWRVDLCAENLRCSDGADLVQCIMLSADRG